MVCQICGANVDLDKHTVESCRKLAWKAMCPVLYQGTDCANLPQRQLKESMAWKYGQRGLLLAGESGKGKTRIAYEVLRREHMAGRRVTIFDCVSFGHKCALKFGEGEGEGEEWTESITKRELVFFDDIDKCKFTDRVESELFGVIERRIANCLPIIATTQLTGQEFGQKFNDRAKGEAIVRRLREFCVTVTF